MSEFTQVFAAYCRSTREAAGLSQRQLAEIAHVGHRTVQRVEAGQGNVRISAHFAIARIFGHTIKLVKR